MKRIFIVFIFFVCLCGLFAQESAFVQKEDSLTIKEKLENVLPSRVVEELLKNGITTHSTYKEDLEFLLSPKSDLVKSNIDMCKNGEPIFLMEALYLYKKTEKSKNSDLEKISRAMRSVSSLKGINYYSTSSEKMKLLYSDAYVTDKIKKGKRLPDPLEKKNNYETFFVVLDDTTLGRNVYNYIFVETSDEVSFFSSNCENMYYGIIKIISANDMKIAFVNKDLGDYILSYAIVTADFLGFPGLKDKLKDSFFNRADAMYKFFIKKIEE